jgi:hypothetical protein
VELIDFTAVGQGKTVQLAWRTATEQNNAYFEVERSLDGLQFEVLGKVAGAGNSTAIQQYQFVDAAPVAGDNFYRLRQVDFDGGDLYSPVVTIVWTAKGELQLSPVPVMDRLKISLPEPQLENAHYVIFDYSGQIVRASTLLELPTALEIDVLSLPKGMYVLQLQADRTLWRGRFLKM